MTAQFKLIAATVFTAAIFLAPAEAQSADRSAPATEVSESTEAVDTQKGDGTKLTRCDAGVSSSVDGDVHLDGTVSAGSVDVDGAPAGVTVCDMAINEKGVPKGELKKNH